MGTVAAVSYGLEQAPKFTLSVLNGALFAAATNLQARIENQRFAEQLIELMRDCGPWREGPRTAETSRLALDKLPPGREAATILDPYYFDFSMVYGDETAREGDVQLFSHAYRLRPCGVVALNFDPRRDDGSLLIDSVICVAYLRGSDLWGRPETFWAMWQEGLPLGDQCLFEIPRWGQLRRITTEAANNALRQLLERQCSLAVEKEAASVEQAAALMDGFDGKTILPTPVERGLACRRVRVLPTCRFGAMAWPLFRCM